MNFKPKLVVFDLDGTLAESKQRVSAEMGEFLSELLLHMPVAVMSGAGFTQFEIQFIPSFPETTRFERLYLFPTNAAQCYTYTNGKWAAKYDHSLNTIEKARIMQALKEAMEETGFTNLSLPVWGNRIEDRGTQITFSALGQDAPVEEKKKWDPMREKRKPLLAALVRRLPDFSVVMNATTSIDITHKGISKAYGIRQLIALTGISVGEMLYVGDALEEGGNDAVVIETGIKTHAVFGPEETTALIKHLLQAT
jgi:HAD superfamily hydrolase (TIGR01484 family)